MTFTPPRLNLLLRIVLIELDAGIPGVFRVGMAHRFSPPGRDRYRAAPALLNLGLESSVDC
jgi:hypothetical protein